MRKLILALFASSVTISGAFAAAHNPLIVWQGGATILTLTSACGTGFEVGDIVHSIYRPRLDPAEPVSGLSLISSRSGSAFYQTGVDNQMRGAGTYSGDFIGARVTNNTGPNTGTFNLTVTPAVITENTAYVDIAGSITNFLNIVGCTVTFRGSYNRRPN